MNLSDMASCLGATPQRTGSYFEPAMFAMGEYGIDTPKRQAAFLAQCGHETGGLQWMTELGSPDYFAKYDGRSDLGNTQPGDGYKFRGRSWIQLTGRANYEKAAGALCLDCVNNPDMISTPTYAPLIAAWFWEDHHLNELADVGNFDSITRIINGGLTNQADRLARWAKAKQVLGVAA